MSRKFSRNTLEDAFKELAELRKRIDDMTNNKEKSLPFRDKDNFPPGVEGQIVLADYIPPAGATALGDMIVLGYRTADDFYQSVYKVNADTGLATELLAGDTTDGSLEYHYSLWSRDRTKIYADKFVDSTTVEMWTVNSDGTGATMLLELTGLYHYSGVPRISFKDTVAGLKVLYIDNGSPYLLNLFDVSAGTSTPIFSTASLPSGYTGIRPDTVQWNPDGTKISFWVEGSSIESLFTLNIDGTGLHGPILGTGSSYATATKGVWWSSLNKITYQTGSPNFYLGIINPDGTGQDELNSVASSYGIFSPDGSKIAWVPTSSGAGEVNIMNADGSGNVVVPSSDMAADNSPNRIAWSPDGASISRIGYENEPNHLMIIDVATASVITDVVMDVHYCTMLHWDPFWEQGQFN